MLGFTGTYKGKEYLYKGLGWESHQYPIYITELIKRLWS